MGGKVGGGKWEGGRGGGEALVKTTTKVASNKGHTQMVVLLWIALSNLN